MAQGEKIEELLVLTTRLETSLEHVLKTQDAFQKKQDELKAETRLAILEHQVLYWEKWFMRVWALVGPLAAVVLGYYLKK